MPAEARDARGDAYGDAYAHGLGSREDGAWGDARAARFKAAQSPPLSGQLHLRNKSC